MKIAVIVEAFPALSQTFILNQITGLIDRGHEVYIYAEMSDPMQKMHSDIEKYQLLERTYYQPKPPRNKVLRFLEAILLFISSFLKDPILVLRSLNVFKYGKDAASLRILYAAVPFLGNRQTYDIIQCHFGLLGKKGMFLRSIGAINGPLLAAFHGVDVTQNIQLLGKDLYADLFEDSDLLMPSTEHFRRRLIDLGSKPEKTLLHYLGLDTEKFKFVPRYAPEDGRIKLITVARLTEKKGIEYSIRGVAKVSKAYPNLQFDIIGDGHLRSSLEDLIHELRLDGVVNLLGAKNRDEIIAALSQAHIFLHPSVTPKSGDQEGSPLAIQEAMAMGLPVISTYHAGIPELVENGVSGFLVPEKDADTLAEKLLLLVQYPEQWAEMGQAGRKRVEQQRDINKLNDRLVKLYQMMIQAGKVNQMDLDEVSNPSEPSLSANL